VNRYRVLIVDDEPGLRRTLERALRGHDYEVVSVGDPNSAYQVLGETHFDVVLLDLRLPQISGDTFFLAIVRKWPRLLGRVILMTGDLLPRQPDWPIELAGCPVLHKPFSLDTLTTTVSGVLAEFEPHSDIREGNGNP
jgi:DNA-binding NtrC family response regulator